MYVEKKKLECRHTYVKKEARKKYAEIENLDLSVLFAFKVMCCWLSRGSNKQRI